jgi:hypothetical protein
MAQSTDDVFGTNEYWGDPGKPGGWSVVETVWTAIVASVCVMAGLPVLGGEAPVWIQPAAVGLIWGAVFVLGFWSGGSRCVDGKSLLLLVTAGLWLTYRFKMMTDFLFAESLLLTVLVVGSGWLAARNFQDLAHSHWTRVRIYPKNQLSIGDLFFLTTFGACVVWAMGQMSSHPLAFVGVLGTLVVGCFGSWAVIDFAWNDRRPMGLSFAIAVAVLLTGLAVIVWLTPMMTWWDRVDWVVSGPLSVCTTQCLTVLVAFAAIRKNADLTQEQEFLPVPVSNNELKIYV